jgi:hypothetical protein
MRETQLSRASASVSDHEREKKLTETTMQNTVITILGASLIVASTVQLAVAAERYTRKMERARATASYQFRNANHSLDWPSVEQQILSDYSEGHVISAPAGH